MIKCCSFNIGIRISGKGKKCEAIILILTVLIALFNRRFLLLITVISGSMLVVNWVGWLAEYLWPTPVCLSVEAAGWRLLLNSSWNITLMGMEHDLSSPSPPGFSGWQRQAVFCSMSDQMLTWKGVKRTTVKEGEHVWMCSLGTLVFFHELPDDWALERPPCPLSWTVNTASYA